MSIPWLQTTRASGNTGPDNDPEDSESIWASIQSGGTDQAWEGSTVYNDNHAVFKANGTTFQGLRYGNSGSVNVRPWDDSEGIDGAVLVYSDTTSVARQR